SLAGIPIGSRTFVSLSPDGGLAGKYWQAPGLPCGRANGTGTSVGRWEGSQSKGTSLCLVANTSQDLLLSDHDQWSTAIIGMPYPSKKPGSQLICCKKSAVPTVSAKTREAISCLVT